MKTNAPEDLGILDACVSSGQKYVLNGGSGPRSGNGLHAIFRSSTWREVRMDINPATAPDVIGSITDMRSSISSGSFDAVWSSHCLEHLHSYEVPSALSEFQRVLKPDGFALIRCPDLDLIASLLLDQGLDCIAYVSPIGPVTPLDMLFGHSASVAAGNCHMAHKTGFTEARLGRLLLEAGFATVLATTDSFDLWALALMACADEGLILSRFQAAHFNIFDNMR
jgi:SAM-dependent methyltransferase